MATYELTRVGDDLILCGPFTFRRRVGEYREEAWELSITDAGPDLKITHFCVKNYGPIRRTGDAMDSFSGWRVVSGGPFSDAGVWATRDEAILGATPWFVRYYIRYARERITEAERLIAAASGFLTSVGKKPC